MRHAYERDANRVGAMALALADRIQAAVEQAGGHGASGPAALAALHGTAAGASIDALARIVGLTHSGAVRLVDRLEGVGLVERRRGVDHRSTALWLTPSGRRAARRVLDQRAAVIDSALAELSVPDRAALVRASERLLPRLAGGQEGERRVCRLCDSDVCGRPEGICPMQVAGITIDRL
jgi:MarR family transcriptional regulator, negative regulator of the multidrug operon emrRAB